MQIRGSVNFLDATNLSQRDLRFQVKCENRLWQFRAFNERESDEWVEHIRSVCKNDRNLLCF